MRLGRQIATLSKAMLVFWTALIASVLVTGGPASASGAAQDQSRARLVLAAPYPLASLDPHARSGPLAATARLTFYDSLLRWSGNLPRLQPWLAESFERSPDRMSYTFKLRSDVKFHDGKPLQAADVVYSVERFLALSNPVPNGLGAILAPGATRAQGTDTVVFNLRQASPNLPALVADVAIVNRLLVRENEKNNDWGSGWLTNTSAGSGGYFAVRHDPGGGFVALRNPRHFSNAWGERPFEQIELRVLADPARRLAALVGGEVQGIVGLLPVDQLAAVRAAPAIEVIEQPTLRMVRAALHNRREPTSDQAFRKALSYAFDYDGFIKALLAGTIARNGSPLPQLLAGKGGSVGYSFDIEKARAHLRDVKSPLREITIGVVAGQPHAEMAAAILQSGLEKIGVKSRVVAEPAAAIEARARDDKQMYDVLFRVEAGMPPDLGAWIDERYGCGSIGAGNYGFYCSKEVDAIAQRAASAGDPNGRLALYRAASRIIEGDAAGLWIGTAVSIAAFSKGVKGIYICPSSEGLDLRLATLDPEAQR